ncbi:MAG TPA: S41 family peptidase [Solirubrobacteraceae bacterium]|jgi:carboxyl-terminal processing protease|nr:S41 family peptidase [Solirubrobacteraceae bacterium]
MSSSRRQPLIVVLVVLLPVLLVIGLWLGGHPEDLPGFLRSAFVSSSQTQVVDEAIKRIADDYYRPIPTSKLDDSSITGLVESLDDRFSHYLSPSEFREFAAPPHFTGIGVAVATQLSADHGLLIEHVFNSSPAARAGLKAGDLIVAVNGRKLERLSAETATALIRGLPGTDVRLGIQGPGGGGSVGGGSVGASLRSIKLTRAVVSEPVVESITKTVHGVKLGVVALASFSPGSHVEVREAVEHELHAGARGLVFDLRGNGGGLVAEAQLIASIFIPKGVIVTTRGRTQPTQVLVATGGAISSSIPMVVLVDSNTASSSEIVTAALQDHQRASVVGTHTFGKGVFQEEQPLSNGGALDITVGEYFTPNGRNLGGGGVKQGAGVTPEVAVPKNVVDTNRGLEVALSTLAAKVK